VALVAERWYVALVAERCRMEFPVGFFNAPNFFFQVLSLPVTVYYALALYMYVNSNLTTLTLTEYRIPSLSVNFASCTRYFFVLFYSFLLVRLAHFIETSRLPPPYTKTIVWQSQSSILIRLF
jgi:hypothetical protein